MNATTNTTAGSTPRSFADATIVQPVQLLDDASAVRIIDQRRLPREYVERDLRTRDDVVDAIRTLAVRGAPAIGVCAAAGLAVAMRAHAADSRDAAISALHTHAAHIRASRPTAVNLAWAVDRCVARALATPGDARAIVDAIIVETRDIHEADLAMGRAIGSNGLALLGDPVRVLTHCNTGALATAGTGTALAVVYAAHAAGRRVHVYASETRPLLQGARLTAWELSRAGIPVTVLADGAAAALMRSGAVDAVFVGADRIAANGDAANKIGTYAHAVAARHHDIPFYVCAPWSTIDAATRSGAEIPIEMRAREELAAIGDTVLMPSDADAWNPAFDVTPADLITAIITDRGVHRAPFHFAST